MIMGLGLCAAVVLLALGLFQTFSTRTPPEAKAAPVAPPPAPRQSTAIEVSPGTATDGHFVIRLLGGTSGR
jgi:hypothetical protein